ncbi:IclR family transcriptional regulator [Nonomuraea sp. CA-218870]|uniref:IclR family transcriptional regulator n=1 Tax=Nonomuraea sp. CA-218870 TaxID=3239998 RepID=UPI003D8C12CD
MADKQQPGRPKGTPQYPIESVDNALRLLLWFRDHRQIRLTDASTHLGVASSTAHRLLAMLQYRGFVRQNPATRAYEPGPALSSVASAIVRHVDVRTRVRPVLERLNKEFGETVHLARLEGHSVNFLDAVESTRAVRVSSRAGMVVPAHATSSGKAMLSRLPMEDLRELYPDEALEPVTRNTLVTRDELEAAVEQARRRGYATSQEESEEGVASVAVAIESPSGTLFCLNVSVPTYRMTASLKKEIAQSLKNAADELSAELV